MKRALSALNIVLAGGITLYGVLFRGWNASALVVLFVLEGMIVLLTDYIRYPFLAGKSRTRQSLVVETAFILFYGMFAVLVFGPYDSLESLIGDGARLIVDLVRIDLRQALIGILAVRLVNVGEEILFARGGGSRPVRLKGVGWMLLLFLAVMTAPLVSRSGPNPAGGLTVLVLLKTAGELLVLFDKQLARLIPDPRRRRA